MMYYTFFVLLHIYNIKRNLQWQYIKINTSGCISSLFGVLIVTLRLKIK